MSNNQISRKACCRIASLALAAILMLPLAACGGKDQEPLRAPESTAAATTVAIETVYGPMAFPENLYSSVRHMEVTEGKTAMEVFYMVSEEGEKELFRIYFADDDMGTHMGYLTVDGTELPVSYSVCEYADENFANEEERKLYHSMMDAFSVVINSFYEDTRFSETRAVAPVGEREVKLRYWKLILPENVRYTETEENGNYCVEFYGEVSGERIDLYMIGLGDLEGESMLGLYKIKDKQIPIMVRTGNMEEYENWSEEEQTIIYNMMASLNTVIQTIVADENFAEPEPGA